MRSVLSTLSALAVAAALSACVPLEPFRYRLADPQADCARVPDSDACRHASSERTDAYDLHFIEFDDQGLQYPGIFAPSEQWPLAPADRNTDCVATKTDCLQRPVWAYQINNLMKQLNQAADAPGYNGITLVVFVHGWKHNAREGDRNLGNFRKLLQTAALMEASRDARRDTAQVALPKSSTGLGRRVVGVYVSWRGASTTIPYVENVTFWSRKSAAMHVAQGSSRELFARLRGFKCVQNAKQDAAGGRGCNKPPSKDDRVKVVLIGHSFGGLVLYNAISGSLIESATRAFDAEEGSDAPYWRFGDIAVLINPAFEATRYAPLFRIVSTLAPTRYEAPLLVTVTSTGDQATGIAFPLGRAINTFFERHADDGEKAANRETVGHHVPFITHRLRYLRGEDSRCAGWQPLPKADDPTLPAVLARDIVAEYRNSAEYYRDNGTGLGSDRYRLREDAKPRRFCGDTEMTLVAGDVNAPVWNVQVEKDADLLPDHSDIMQPLFVTFFRQLYMDTIFLDDMTGRGELKR